MAPDQIIALVPALAGAGPTDPLFPVIAAGGVDSRGPVTTASCPGPIASDEVEGHEDAVEGSTFSKTKTNRTVGESI